MLYQQRAFFLQADKHRPVSLIPVPVDGQQRGCECGISPAQPSRGLLEQRSLIPISCGIAAISKVWLGTQLMEKKKKK